jgi:glycosyltransferase involved in cell wall biosynthesis
LGTEGKVIKNFYPFLYNAQKQNDSSEEKILWIGRMRKEKRPDLFLDLAKSLPEVKFRMIGGPSSVHPNFYYEIKEAADKINNLDFIGFVPHNQIGKYYNETTLLINTSPSEGFPNTFLEAWGNGVPVVSLGFDPDEIICTNNLGLHSKTYNQMIEDVKYLLKNEQLRKEMGANSRNYIEENHNLNKLVEEYEQVFKFLMKKNNNTQKLAY